MAGGVYDVSPDLLFILSLVAKMTVTALFLVGATFTAERAGPVVGGMISTLPISAGPAYVFLSLDHDVSFISAAALGSFVINSAICVFALTYAALAQRCRLATSVGIGLVVWFAFAAILRLFAWTTTTAILFNIVVFAICLVVGNRFRHAKMPLATRRWYDIPLRAVMVATLVAVIIVLSESFGAVLTGILTAFPIVLLSLMLILHPRLGGPATAAVLANGMLGLVGFASFCLVLHLAVVPLGFAAGFCLAVAVNVGCNLAFWAIRRRSVRA
jgi:uncharacterized membrane protein (GlpM family)